MELEFDKEIDAILRRARGGEAVNSAAAGSHLDADTINAFVENALPSRARAAYTAHFADCNQCRKLLSSSISLNTAAVSAAGIAAESVGDTAAAAIAIPWYSKLFRTPGLALGMGALVIVFSGVLGYMVFQNRGGSAPAVSQLKTPEYQNESAANSSNANAAVAAANTSSNSMSNTAAANTASVPEPLVENARPGGPSATSNTSIATGTASTDTIASSNGGGSTGSPMAAPPPPPVTSAKPADTGRNAEVAGALRAGDDKDEKEKTATSRSEDTRRDLPMTASKVGPSRAGPVQNQSNNVNQQLSEMSVTRSAGGKTFSNRDGAWYDSAYHGQSTINVSRGSEDFKKLDGGLRSIANKISGVVVVVWGGKAYRIQ